MDSEVLSVVDQELDRAERRIDKPVLPDARLGVPVELQQPIHARRARREHFHHQVRSALDPGLHDLSPLGGDVEDIGLRHRVIGEVNVHRRHKRFATLCLGDVIQQTPDAANHDLVKANRTRTQVEPAMDEFAAGFVGKCVVVGPAIGTGTAGHGRRRLFEQRHGHAWEYTEGRRGVSSRLAFPRTPRQIRSSDEPVDPELSRPARRPRARRLDRPAASLPRFAGWTPLSR